MIIYSKENAIFSRKNISFSFQFSQQFDVSGERSGKRKCHGLVGSPRHSLIFILEQYAVFSWHFCRASLLLLRITTLCLDYVIIAELNV